MFNDVAGDRRSIEDADCLVSHPESHGCLLFGPYDWMPPGRYRAEFRLALGGEPIDPERPSVVLDVAAGVGTVLLATRTVFVSDLSDRLKTYAVEFSIFEYRQLEYRAHAAANGSVIVSTARIVKLSDIDELSSVDVGVTSADPFMLARQVRTVLRLLRPRRAVGSNKVRLGKISDGGYICLDHFVGIDTALSFGINDDISWDRDAADRGLRVFQFDHTVEDPAPNDDRFVFQKKMIAPERGPDRETIADLVHSHDRGGARPNIVLKMDIENAEWPVLMATMKSDLSRFSQIVCELHYFQGLSDAAHRSVVFECLSRLSEDYAVVHIHANNYAGWVEIANIMVPCVLEVTFANRSVFQFEETDDLFPTSLDASCDPTHPDMFLGSFRF